jgi:uncharacterized SAM-binding protein YcdF (DUF218 family)
MKAKAFVSSTYEDLKSHRLTVLETLLHLGIEPLMMEHWGAFPSEPKEVCFNKIKECDVFIGIYAHRYGFRPDPQSKSITALEFDYARNLSKPPYCYIVDEDCPWPPKMIDRGQDYVDLESFKTRVRAELKIKFFCSPESLGRWIAGDLGNWLHDPLVRSQLKLPTPVRAKTLIAVFGKRLIEDVITKEGLSRIIALVDYLNNAHAAKDDIIITFTGGRIDRHDISESETFRSTYYRYLYERQANFSQIISHPVRLDRKSTNTVENVQNIIEMMKNEGALEPGINLIVKLCSSGYHLDRLMAIHDLLPPKSILSIFETDELLEKTKTSVKLAGRNEHLRAFEDILVRSRGELYTAIDKLTLFRVLMEWAIDNVRRIESKTLTESKLALHLEKCIKELNEQQGFDACEKVFDETNLCFKRINHLLSANVLTDIPVEMIAGVIKVMSDTVDRCRKNHTNLIHEYNLFNRLLTDINRVVDPDEKVDVDAPRLEL